MKRIAFLGLIITLTFSSCVTKRQNNISVEQLNGTWELIFISGPRIAFEGLYPNNKPQLTFEVATQKLSGNTGCNNLNGALVVNANNIDFSAPIATTKRFCEGQGEDIFLTILRKINKFSIVKGDTLNLMANDIVLMKLIKKS